MFIARRDSATLLCSEERHPFEPTWDGSAALPNRAGGEWLAAINMSLLRSGNPDIVLFAF